MFGQGFDSPQLHNAPLRSAFDWLISSGQSNALKANHCSLDGIQTLVLRALAANQIIAKSHQFLMACCKLGLNSVYPPSLK